MFLMERGAVEVHYGVSSVLISTIFNVIVSSTYPLLPTHPSHNSKGGITPVHAAPASAATVLAFSKSHPET